MTKGEETTIFHLDFLKTSHNINEALCFFAQRLLLLFFIRLYLNRIAPIRLVYSEAHKRYLEIIKAF